MNSLGPLASALAIRFSDRMVTILGGVLAASGLCLSYFATSVKMLCFTLVDQALLVQYRNFDFNFHRYGVIGGLGSGLAYPIGVFIVARYFEKKRGMANGLCTSGSALGSVLMPQLLQFLLSSYGCRFVVSGFKMLE